MRSPGKVIDNTIDLNMEEKKPKEKVRRNLPFEEHEKK